MERNEQSKARSQEERLAGEMREGAPVLKSKGTNMQFTVLEI